MVFQQCTSMTAADQWILGTNVRVILGDGSVDVEGTVWVLDAQTGMMVLRQACPGGKWSMRFVKIAAIRRIEVLSPKQNDDTTAKQDDQLPMLSTDRLEARERRAVDEFNKKIARIGVGVTAEAQELFDVLIKTFPCRWRGSDIVVMDEVSITPPYAVENCSGKDPAALAHIQKVVAHAHARIKQ